MLPILEFAVNNTPNRTTGYTAFYLNYGYHPLNPIQMLSSTSDTTNEAVSRFASRMQVDFTVALENLTKATQQMRAQEESHRRLVEFREGDLVLLSTRHLRFRHCPQKLQRRFVGPFSVVKKISRVAYELKLPEDWSIHPVFHISLLKQWREGTWSRAVDAPLPEVDQTQQQGYEVERILKYRSVRRGSRRSREYLVIWTGYPLLCAPRKRSVPVALVVRLIATRCKCWILDDSLHSNALPLHSAARTRSRVDYRCQ